MFPTAFKKNKTKMKFGFLTHMQRVEAKPDRYRQRVKMTIHDALSDRAVNVNFSYAQNKKQATHVAMVLHENGNGPDDNKCVVLRRLNSNKDKITLSAPAMAFRKKYEYLIFDWMMPTKR